jgi:hypothetical protein
LSGLRRRITEEFHRVFDAGARGRQAMIYVTDEPCATRTRLPAESTCGLSALRMGQIVVAQKTCRFHRAQQWVGIVARPDCREDRLGRLDCGQAGLRSIRGVRRSRFARIICFALVGYANSALQPIGQKPRVRPRAARKNSAPILKNQGRRISHRPARYSSGDGAKKAA